MNYLPVFTFDSDIVVAFFVLDFHRRAGQIHRRAKLTTKILKFYEIIEKLFSLTHVSASRFFLFLWPFCKAFQGHWNSHQPIDMQIFSSIFFHCSPLCSARGELSRLSAHRMIMKNQLTFRSPRRINFFSALIKYESGSRVDALVMSLPSGKTIKEEEDGGGKDAEQGELVFSEA